MDLAERLALHRPRVAAGWAEGIHGGDAVDDAASRALHQAAAAASTSASNAYEIRAIAGNVTYVWEGTVGNSGVWQVGPNVLRSLNGVSDMDIAGTVGVVGGLGIGSRAASAGRAPVGRARAPW